MEQKISEQQQPQSQSPKQAPSKKNDDAPSFMSGRRGSNVSLGKKMTIAPLEHALGDLKPSDQGCNPESESNNFEGIIEILL